MNTRFRGTCTLCDQELLDEGFIEDMGDSSQGYSRWIPGPLEQGFLGGVRRLGRQRLAIAAYRCRSCGHLELFADAPI